MSLQKKAITGIKWNFLQVICYQLIAFFVFLLLARLLKPEDFGLVALASVFIQSTRTFVTFGFSTAIVQRHNLDTEHLDTAFWANLGISITVIFLTFFSAEEIAALFGEPRLAPIITWLSIGFLFSALINVQTAILLRKFDFKLLALRSMTGSLVGGLVGVMLALLNFGAWSLVGRQLTTSLVGVVLIWSIADWRPRFKFSIKHGKDLFNFGISVTGIELLNVVNRHADNFIIGYFLGPVALGYYNIAYRLITIVSDLLVGVVERVMMPTFSRLQKETKRLQRNFYNVIQIVSLISFPAFFAISLLSPELVIMLFGEKWTPSIPVMQVLALVGILQSVLRFHAVIIISLGKPNWRLTLQILEAMTNVIGFLIAVRWGIVAVAISYTIVNFFMFPFWLWAVNRLIKINFKAYLWQFLPAVTGSFIMVMWILFLKGLFNQKFGPVPVLVTCTVGGIILYLLTIYLVSPSLVVKVFNIGKGFLPKIGSKV